jgi:hypothetical protein
MSFFAFRNWNPWRRYVGEQKPGGMEEEESLE